MATFSGSEPSRHRLERQFNSAVKSSILMRYCSSNSAASTLKLQR